MSRSWERKVRKNRSKINQSRKKQGSGKMILTSEKTDTFLGRNLATPILLLLFVTFYNIVSFGNPIYKATAIHWVTVACYILLAALFFFRKPYLTVGKDYVQSRRLTGDKRLHATAIKAIHAQNGNVTILPQKGTGWTFSKLMNRFKTVEMTEKLRMFASAHDIPFEQK